MKLQTEAHIRQISARPRRPTASQIQPQSPSRSDQNVHHVSARWLDGVKVYEDPEQLKFGNGTATQLGSQQWNLQDEEDLIEL